MLAKSILRSSTVSKLDKAKERLSRLEEGEPVVVEVAYGDFVVLLKEGQACSVATVRFVRLIHRGYVICALQDGFFVLTHFISVRIVMVHVVNLA